MKQWDPNKRCINKCSCIAGYCCCICLFCCFYLCAWAGGDSGVLDSPDGGKKK